jgi:hypothetical protein
LTKLIAQLVDMKSGRHAADCHETAAARPSSAEILKTLYELIDRDRDRTAAAAVPLPMAVMALS